MANATDPLASGGSTTEGKLSIFSAIAGVIVAILAVLEPLFQQAADANPNSFWLRLAVAVAGLAVTAASTWSFTKSRTLVKGGILDVLQEGAVALAPMVASVVLKKYLDPSTQQALNTTQGNVLSAPPVVSGALTAAPSTMPPAVAPLAPKPRP